ncbi:MAG: hypothetical protein K6E63_04205 [Lachnospiraceae bacterium]|nr:hypothetical protein [Lachnospiraceae bacterium]
MQNNNEIEPNIERITGFAGAKFGGSPDGSSMRKDADNPLRRLFNSDNSEMFEGSENFTWIDRE